MPLTVFDAVGKFSADTRNLDEFVAKLDRALPDASQKSAAATKILKDAQDNLKDSLRALRAEGGDTATNWQKVADAQRQVAIASQANKRAQDDLKKSVGAVNEEHGNLRREFGLLDNTIRGAHGAAMVDLIRSFENSKIVMAALPLVGTAGLFAFLFSVLGEGVTTVEEVTRALAGWSEEARQAYANQVKLNQVFIELSNQHAEAKIREKERGLEGANLTRQQIADDQELLKLIGQRLTGLTKLRETMQGQLDVEKSVGSAVEAWAKGSIFIQERQDRIQSLTAGIKSIDEQVVAGLKQQLQLKQQQGDREAQLNHQSLSEYIQTETAKTEAKRVQSQAQLDVDLAVWRNELSQRIITSNDLVSLEAQTEEQRHQIDMDALERKLQLLQLDPTKNRDAIITANAQIEALERQHQAKLIDDERDFIERKRAILQQSLSLKPTDAASPNAITLSVNDQQLLQAMQILAKLGDQTAQTAQRAGEAQAAYDLLIQTIENGNKPAIESEVLLSDSVDVFKAKEQDLTTVELLALRQMLLEEIAATEAWGGAIDELERKLAKVNQRISQQITHHTRIRQLLKQLTPEMRAYERELELSGSKARAWGAAVGTAISSAASAYAQGAVTIEGALAQIAAAQIRAIADIANAKGTEQMAEAFGSWPDFPAMAHHFASAALWFSLGALTSFAAGKLSNVGQGGGGGGTSDAASTAISSPAAQSDPNPVQVTNVQHFARGGLISSPTLAIIGDSITGANRSAREAVLPLDHPEALDAITGELAKRMNAGTVINQRIEGVISADNLAKVMVKMTKAVNRGQARLVSSNSYKTTKRV